jgi:hypothetical protein
VADSIKTICGWCGVYLYGPKDAKRVSHGICDRCAVKWREQIRATKNPSDGYWIDPDGKAGAVIDHFEAVRETPERFGFRRTESKRWKLADRDSIIKRAVGRGWIRVRPHGQFTTFTVDVLSEDVIARIKQHLKRIAAWDIDPIRIEEIGRRRVTDEKAEWILSDAALAAAYNPRKKRRSRR